MHNMPAWPNPLTAVISVILTISSKIIFSTVKTPHAPSIDALNVTSLLKLAVEVTVTEAPLPEMVTALKGIALHVTVAPVGRFARV